MSLNARPITKTTLGEQLTSLFYSVLELFLFTKICRFNIFALALAVIKWTNQIKDKDNVEVEVDYHCTGQSC